MMVELENTLSFFFSLIPPFPMLPYEIQLKGSSSVKLVCMFPLMDSPVLKKNLDRLLK